MVLFLHPGWSIIPHTKKNSIRINLECKKYFKTTNIKLKVQSKNSETVQNEKVNIEDWLKVLYLFSNLMYGRVGNNLHHF